MDGALEEIAFLANSENRVAVLGALVDTPRSRDEMLERIDASRVTMTRILREFEDRDWIEQSGRRYAVTPTGDWVYDAFTRLIEEIAAERRLRRPLQWLPKGVVTFDVRRLRDAEIVLVEERDPTAITRRIVEFHRSGDRIRGVSRSAAPVFVENQWELTVQGDTRLELVMTPEALDVIREHPRTVQQSREMLREGNVRLFVHEGIPVSLGIVNGAVGINLTDEEGVLKAGLISEDEVVHAWAVDLFERCRAEARPVDPDVITA